MTKIKPKEKTIPLEVLFRSAQVQHGWPVPGHSLPLQSVSQRNSCFLCGAVAFFPGFGGPEEKVRKRPSSFSSIECFKKEERKKRIEQEQGKSETVFVFLISFFFSFFFFCLLHQTAENAKWKGDILD